MKCDIILAGVGGQGILTIAYLLDHAAVRRGYRFKQAEVHGMSQRGGAVYSHLRVSDTEVISDLIPLGKADLVLAVEPLEVQRYLRFLSPSGIVVANTEPFKNIPDYPADDLLTAALARLPNCLTVDAKAIATAARMPKAQNMAVLGAATPFLPFVLEDFRPAVAELFLAKGESVVESNMGVLAEGERTGRAFKERLASRGAR
jgi:indolepyruvate ferredoxin oxidoreductase beta subunit